MKKDHDCNCNCNCDCDCGGGSGCSCKKELKYAQEFLDTILEIAQSDIANELKLSLIRIAILTYHKYLINKKDK